MTALEKLAALERRARAIAEFCARVRARGSRAVVEEDEDLVALRLEWTLLRAAVRAAPTRAA